MESIELLRTELRSGNCLVVVGTGSSVAITGNDPKASWTGLLLSGIALARSLNLVADDVADGMVGVLETSTNPDELLEIASRLVDAMGGPQSGQFSRWLRSDVGYLPQRNVALAEAIGALGLPILTTNYDDLLERSLGRDHVTWQEPGAMQLIISSKSRDIGHLHGFWSQPKSIVLTREQYELMLEDRQLEVLRQAMLAINSIVYVGFGAGLDDPTFANLRAWMLDSLPGGEVRHFRLCLESERENLLIAHRGESIVPVSYGESHEALVDFLRDLAPSQEVAQLSGPESYFQIVEEQVREGAILVPHIRDAEAARISDLTIPPVLLTVSQEQFIAATREIDSSRPSRCSAEDEALHPRMLIAGEEHVGVSTALLWLAGQKCLVDPLLIPVTIDYLTLSTSGINPLRKSVVRALRSSGFWLREGDELPAVVLVLDNVHLGAHPRLDRVISEIANGGYSHVLIGCRVGLDGDILERLNSDTDTFERRYVGRLSKRDVRALVALVDPSRNTMLAEKAIEVVRAHSLPSTPFTFSMILSALLRGESLMAATSPTTLLDAYLDLLMGRGGYAEDSRYGLDAANRGYILGQLAELFVSHNVGALPQLVVVEKLDHIFRELDWPESPVDVIKDLQQRHILVLRGGEVSFAQSSYLHLFAAKHAQESEDFLSTLIENPLYYAPILAHYAALRRSAYGLVSRLMPLLDPFLYETVRVSAAFVPEKELDRTPKSLEDIERQIDSEAHIAIEANGADEGEDELVPLDARRDDYVPFPLTPVEEQPALARLVTTLGLLSNLLRDTEIFPDHNARKDAVVKVLRGWAQFADRFESETSFFDTVRDVSRQLEEELHLSVKRAERLAEDVRLILPVSMAFGGISATLATRKLSRTVDRCFGSTEFVEDPALAIMGAFLLSEVQTSGWTIPLDDVYRQHGRTPGVRRMLRRVLMISYLSGSHESADEARLQAVLVELAIDDDAPAGARDRSLARGRVIEALKRARLQWRQPQVMSGRSSLLDDGLGDAGEADR